MTFREATRFHWRRIGPVYLYWSEWDFAAVVIGRGGSDLYYCDLCPDFADEAAEAIEHARSHGYDVAA